MRPLLDRLSQGWVEENIRAIGWILGLDEPNELRVSRSLLAIYRVPVRRRIGGEILKR